MANGDFVYIAKQAGSHGEEFWVGFLSVHNNAKWQPNTEIVLCELRSGWGRKLCVDNRFYSSWLNRKEETTCKKVFLNLDFSLQIPLWMQRKISCYSPEALALGAFHIKQGKVLKVRSFLKRKSQRFTSSHANWTDTWAEWRMPLISACRIVEQGDPWFKASLGFTASLGTTWATYPRPCLKNQNWHSKGEIRMWHVQGKHISNSGFHS